MTPSRNRSVRRPDPIRTLLAVLVLALAACGGGEPAEQAEAAPPPPPPPKEEVASESVADVMKRLGIDRRVKMDESERPNMGDVAADTRRLEAVLRFFDAMVKGDADRLRPMLSKPDQETLELMLKDGQWAAATASIDRVTLGCTGGSEQEGCVTLAVFTIGDRFDAQLWNLPDDSKVAFVAVAQPPGILEQLKGSKTEPRVKQWSDALRAMTARAQQPDEKVELAQQDRSIGGEGGEGEESPGGSPSDTPAAPKGPGKRKPGGPSVPAPKGPGGPGGPAGPG